MSEVERALHLLKEGDKVQKNAILRYLPFVFKYDLEGSTKQILEKFILVNLWKEDASDQISYGKSLVKILPLLSRKTVGGMFDFFQSMMNLQNEKVSLAWEETFFVSINYMPLVVIQKEILDFVVEKGSQFETEKNRSFCSRILGVICKRLKKKEIEEKLLSLIINMCQDTSYKVRKHMAKNIEIIAKRLGEEKARRDLTHELFQLIEDETKEVKQSAFQTLVKLLDFFDKKFRKQKILPLFAGLVNNPPHDLMQDLVREFGKIFYSLSNDIIHNEQHISLFENFFINCCQHKDEDIRDFCAFNFPAIVKGFGGKKFVKSFYTVYKRLAKDKSDKIRLKIASSFHIISGELIRFDSYNLLNDIFLKFLIEEGLIHQRIMDNFAITLRNFSESSTKLSRKFLSESYVTYVVKNLSFGQSVMKWRGTDKLFKNIEKCCDLFTNDVIYNTFIPMMKKYLTRGSVILKKNSAKVIVVLSRKLCNYSQQVQFFKMVSVEFGKGKSFWDRMAFLEMVPHIMDFYSRVFFKKYIIDYVMLLSHDKVSEVKQKYCTIMPRLKRILSPSVDVKYIANLKERSSFLELDKDTAVIEAAKKAKEEMISIDKEVSIGHHNIYSFQHWDEKKDKIKEMEEDKWIKMERKSNDSGNSSGKKEGKTGKTTKKRITKKGTTKKGNKKKYQKTKKKNFKSMSK